MKVKLISLDHPYFEGVELPVEVNAYGNTIGPASYLWVTGEELISHGAVQGSQDGTVAGLDPNYMYALEIGVQIDETDVLLETLGIRRKDDAEA